jgi:rubrerythrin
MDHKQKLTELVNKTSSKQLAHAIKRIPELHAWILDETKNWSHLNLTQRVRCILFDDNPVCDRSGHTRVWKSLSQGFGFCGATASCECAKKQVSEKTRVAKQKITPEQQAEINQKRSQTNLTKFGVTNTGQTTKAKQAHADLYSDKQKVKLLVESTQQTNLERYGVTNPMKLETVKQKSVQTLLDKYGVANINQLPERRLALSKQAKSTWARRREGNLDYLRLKQKFEHNHQVMFLTPAEEYQGSVGAHYYKFECMECNHQFEDYIYCGHVPICKICHPAPLPVYSSKQENQLVEWLQQLGVRMKLRDHSLINPYELDIVCVDHNLAIEYYVAICNLSAR